MHTHTHTHTFNGPFSGTTHVSRYQKGKLIWILLKQETVSGSGISWAICKSATRSRQTTMPVPHHSQFLGARWPSCCPTDSFKALKAKNTISCNYKMEFDYCAHFCTFYQSKVQVNSFSDNKKTTLLWKKNTCKSNHAEIRNNRQVHIRF